MLKIRLQRVGRKHEPTFRVVLTDSKNSTKSGRMLEVLGNHDPRHKDMTQLNVEQIKHWISKGAKPTDTMHNMLVSKKIIEGKKVNVLPRKTPIKKEGEAEAGSIASSQAAIPAEPAPAEPTPAPKEPVPAPATPAPSPAEPTPTTEPAPANPQS